MASNALTSLRGLDAGANRQTDAISRLVDPVAKAVMATPIMGAAPPAWIRPPLTGGFLDRGAQYVPTRYHRDALGYVHVEGGVRSALGSAGGSIITTLPVGFRSILELERPAAYSAGTAAAVRLTANGQIQTVLAVAAGAYIDFSFSFLAEQ